MLLSHPARIVLYLCGLSLASLLAAAPATGQEAAQPAEGEGPPSVLLPRQALAPEQLGVIVNELDPLSLRIGSYYAEKRGIPHKNLIRVRFTPGRPVMDQAELERVRAQAVAETPPGVEAYALTWAEPYRAGCMSITTAFAAGYDPAFCATGCVLTRESPLFASDTTQPFTDLGWRPTMAIAARTFEQARALIDRGVAADDARPPGTGYLVETSDQARSTRAPGYAAIIDKLGRAVRLELVKADYIAERRDVLFYFTGAVRVPMIASNRFLPGAAADHLTSTGGQLTDSRQMSSLRWLEAGATGSYGTVVEPCSYPSKFPDPGVLIGAYLSGATLIEAYWKSVRMPGQGIFVGEPLARPFGGHEPSHEDGRWTLSTFALAPGAYEVEVAPGPVGPYTSAGRVVKPGFEPLHIRFPPRAAPYYRLLGPLPTDGAERPAADGAASSRHAAPLPPAEEGQGWGLR